MHQVPYERALKPEREMNAVAGRDDGTCPARVQSVIRSVPSRGSVGSTLRVTPRSGSLTRRYSRYCTDDLTTLRSPFLTQTPV